MKLNADWHYENGFYAICLITLESIISILLTRIIHPIMPNSYYDTTLEFWIQGYSNIYRVAELANYDLIT